MKNIAEILNSIRPEFDFNNSKDFIKEGMLDSFDLITLVAAIEEAFGIKIDGRDIVPENFNSLAAIEALASRSGRKK